MVEFTPEKKRAMAEMRAILVAGNRVRGGFMHWLKGAPTHVLADLLRELEADGWRLTEVESPRGEDRET